MKNTDELELEDTVMNGDQQELHFRTRMKEHPAKNRARSSNGFFTTKMKLFCTVSALLFIIGAATTVVLMSHRASKMDKTITFDEQDETNQSNDWNSDNLDEETSDEFIDDEQIPKLRSYNGYAKSRSSQNLGHTNVYIREKKGKSSQSIRFPAARYSRRGNPFRGSLISFMPRIPIFADRLTKQTIIFSPTGGVYILPPLINFYGKMFSVAELIASGYASLVSSGVPPPINGPIFPSFFPQPLIGPNVPVFDRHRGGFKGGVRTKFRSFSMPKNYEKHSEVNYESESEDEEQEEKETEEVYDNENNNDRYRPDSYETRKRPYKRIKPPRTTTTSTKTTTKSSKKTKLTTTTEPTTMTETTTMYDPIEQDKSILTKCQSDEKHRIFGHTHNRKSRHEKKKYLIGRLKTLTKADKTQAHTRLKGTFVVQFATDSADKDHFKKITEALTKNDQTRSLSIEKRLEFETEFFRGVSITVNNEESLHGLADIEDFIEIYSVSRIRRPNLANHAISSNKAISDGIRSITPHRASGVSEVHEKLKDYGKGVRIGIIDTGIDYKHPALGGCFGIGCKVAGGYDLVGDAYNGEISTAVPDDDPYDDCPTDGHGTHVAGILAANATNIDEAFYTPIVPFVGVAPESTILALTMSIGSNFPYLTDIGTLTVEYVIQMGVYMTIAAGNSGTNGLLTSGDPAIASHAISVASVDNVNTISFKMIAPNGKIIYYRTQPPFANEQSKFESKIVVNDPSRGVNDGCNGLKVSVIDAVVLFAYSLDDTCSIYDRCNNAALYGARGCLTDRSLYFPGLTTIPTGSITTEDSLFIIATVAKDPTGIFKFTDSAKITPVPTALTPSFFTSNGLRYDLEFKPDISAVGGFVYSTLSTAASENLKLTSAYVTYSGTSMSTPYMAGVLALFLSHIGNPAPSTVNGTSPDGKCRPKANFVRDLFQSTTTIVKEYNSSLFASTLRQGAGLVDAIDGITATAMFSPSKLGLNDTVRQHKSYTVHLLNIGDKLARYRLSHRGAAMATGKQPNNDLLLAAPLYSPDYADVDIEPRECEIRPGKSQRITLRFTAPKNADPSLLPFYSGFIYAKNQDNGEIVHMSYAGVVGDFKQARKLVRQTPSGIITGIQDAHGKYVTDGEIPTLNVTEGATIVLVLAYATSIAYIEAIAPVDNILPGYDINYGLLFNNSVGPFYGTDWPRNADVKIETDYLKSYPYLWKGQIAQIFFSGNTSIIFNQKLPPGQYRVRYSALKNFGNYNNSDDFDVYITPVFNLVY
ncbi:unnamed protein product [Adineta steineri]|uniref:Peptidase S8/S53 domain-containing protein n=1 Tax=Adineta steineri TaxID=433720 RepID=A0A814MBF0_9BILA|nr:unnamed protein product [Adineta steineri]CAF1077068.1 unnamed protein product [Adineta steineri]